MSDYVLRCTKVHDDGTATLGAEFLSFYITKHGGTYRPDLLRRLVFSERERRTQMEIFNGAVGAMMNTTQNRRDYLFFLGFLQFLVDMDVLDEPRVMHAVADCVYRHKEF